MRGEEFTKESRALSELTEATRERGWPDEAARIIAGQLRSERSVRRMISYLRNARPRRFEDAADEMLAIMEERRKWIEKKESEESWARYNAWLGSEERSE